MDEIAQNVELIRKSGLFDSNWYLSEYPDVAEININPVQHFIKYGTYLGRNPSKTFDTQYYLSSNPDVAQAGINPLVHFIENGEKEGRLTAAPTSIFTNNISALPSTEQTRHSNHSVQKSTRWNESISIIKELSKDQVLANRIIASDVINLAKEKVRLASPKISVIMPSWNREHTICKAIDSILSQSYLPFEILISDDGSTDETIQKVNNRYRKEVNKGLITLLENTHQGVSATRNSGLKAAKGELIAYLDSDNIWREHYLLLMASAFSENDELNCAYSALESNDKNNNINKIRSTTYNRKQLLNGNFIDLNVFIHRKSLFSQFGGFDTSLKRLVDWDLILRYTRNYTPAYIPFVGVDYYLDDKLLKNITTTVNLDSNRQNILHSHFKERVRYNLESLRLAYVLWDFPVLSQTFVMEELKWLIKEGYDVKVYYSIKPDKAAKLDFDINAYVVNDAEELSFLLKEHKRNLCHTHFAYPATTLLTYPACIKTNTHFTFMPHAVDIFHHENKKRNKIGEIAQHPLCMKVFVHGQFHKHFLETCGVPVSKIMYNLQAVDLKGFNKKGVSESKIRKKSAIFKGVVISRFVEKKGIDCLIKVAELLKDEKVEFHIYGYGPLKDNYINTINRLNLKNIYIKDPLDTQKEVSRVYNSCDFLIAPCVVAENGDMDGFPTVILEGMASGLPVITTDIAAIPDYLSNNIEALVAKAGDSFQIAQRVRTLINMSAHQKSAMIQRSHQFLNKKIGVNRTMNRLLDTWTHHSIDIFMVTYDTGNYKNKEETFEIIDRIFKFTTTPFTLTIVDNNSDIGFWSDLCDKVKGNLNVRLIRKHKNKYCGPASNIALELSEGEFSIYICSKEGFIKSHGWERTLIEQMSSNPKNVLGGHLSQTPNYIYGHEYLKRTDFSHFRNNEFAKKNPNRVFKHIQGGLYVIRNDFVKKYGGFNPAMIQGAMDIELSYYIESLGYGLLEIPEVESLTTKTLPNLPTILNEHTVAAHPLTITSVSNELDSLTKTNGNRCNICNWKGESFLPEESNTDPSLRCPKCNSIGFGRSIVKILANNHHIYRKEKCYVLSHDFSLKRKLRELFSVVHLDDKSDKFLAALKGSIKEIDVIIMDHEIMDKYLAPKIWKTIVKKLSPLGEVIFTDSSFKDDSILKDAIDSSNKYLAKALSYATDKFSIEHVDISSYCIGYDWRRFAIMTRLLKES